MKYLFALVALVSMVSCSSEAQTNESSDRTISEVVSVTEFKDKMTMEDVQIIDVRTPQEYAGGKIGDAQNINFHDADFKAQMDALDKTKPTLIYCAAGGRSARARTMMSDLGFEEVYELDGGYGAWH